jgi:hypothetical protein
MELRAEFERWVENYLDQHGYAPTCFETFKWFTERGSSKKDIDASSDNGSADKSIRSVS